METLTKENFWNEMANKYPFVMADFRKWIDRYKDDNKWYSLFPYVERPQHWMAIKFHHLPLAMQMGIWNQYVDYKNADIEHCKWEIEKILKEYENRQTQTNANNK